MIETRPQNKKKQAGQASVEVVLLLTLSLAIFVAVSSVFRDKQIFSQILSRPWTNLSSMIQNGVWSQNQLHPAHSGRWISVAGEER